MTTLWSPSSTRVENSHLSKFISAALRSFDSFADLEDLTNADSHKIPKPTYDQIHNWSINYPNQFWPLIWDYCNLLGDRDLAYPAVSGYEDFESASWFEGSNLSFAHNLLAKGKPENLAITSYFEDRSCINVTYSQLNECVRRVALGLRNFGVEPGDRVAVILPNVAQSIIAFLATNSLGAIFSSCSPDFGYSSIYDRLVQVKPKVLLASDGYTFKGKWISISETVKSLSEKLPELEQIFTIPYKSSPLTSNGWGGLLESKSEMELFKSPFSYPLYILFSSGTTGLPKCIVHGAGRVLVEHLKELMLHTDLKESDIIFYNTTCGWMMWNWLVSSLAVGSTVVLYDGSPLYPDPLSMPRLIEEAGVTLFGSGARYFNSLSQLEVCPKSQVDLCSLRTILSTGSPLLPEDFDFIYQQFKEDLHLASISGGTDIVGLFVGGNPNAPVVRGEIQCPILGKAVKIYDEHGRSVIDSVGELVCEKPFPATPIGFWGERDNLRFHNAYFNRFENCWHHGDFAQITQSGGIVILGRSDATLNRGGIRVGTAEIYRLLKAFPEICDSVVVAKEVAGDQMIVLFCQITPPHLLDEKRIAEIKKHIRLNSSPRHVPDLIIAAPDIPRTWSGKTAELAVREAINSRPVKNEASLSNPESLKFFKIISWD